MTSSPSVASFDRRTVAPSAKGPWDQMVCFLPDCGADVYMERHTSRAIMAGDTANDLRNDEHVRSWSVTCGNGHVLLNSESQDESPLFGSCAWHDNEEHHCGRLDLDRLAQVTRVGKHDHVWLPDGVCRDCGDARPNASSDSSPALQKPPYREREETP